MEIIGIETATYEKTLKEIENFLDTIDKLITASSHKTIGEWLDNQEVCLILKIAPRTLQNLRDTDQISYSQIGKKIYYKKEDIEKKSQEDTVQGTQDEIKDIQDNEQILQIYNRLKETLMRLESILKDNTPTLNGHRYMNDSELANYLKVSRRTLQEYRNNGILPYYQIGGKILYRESDIEELLEKNRQEAFQ